MKSACIIAIGLALVAGFFAGRLTAPCPTPVPADRLDPQAALDELRTYRGQGARAERTLVPLAEAVAAGGEAMLPALEKELAEGKNHDYHLPPTFDHDACVLGKYRTRRMALIDAVNLIGGAEAVRILLANARVPTATSEERSAANLFLARRGDRPEVREHFTKELRRHLVTHREDMEMMHFLMSSRGHLEPDVFEDLMKAFAEGWPKGVDPQSVYAEMGETLASLDEERAKKLFLRLIADAGEAPKARAAAAMSVVRIPEARPLALEILLREENQQFLRFYVKGGKHGRFGEAFLIRNADESKDPEVRIAFLEEWIAIQRQFAKQLEEIAARALPAVRQGLDLEQNKAYLTRQIQDAEGRLAYERKHAGD